MDKPRQGPRGLFNISFGFFGIQVAFGLQNANVSRIFQSLGSPVDELAILWIAGPVTGLLVQPVIGHYSDRTWGPLGRRRPYFLAGAVLAAGALVGMPNAGLLLAAAALLWLLDAALNVSMEPFRAFVGDMVGPAERARGYAFQTAFIGAGAVLGSLAPFALTALGVPNTAPEGVIPPSVRWSFYIGAFAIVAAVLWTVVTVREHPPEAMRAFNGPEPEPAPRAPPGGGVLWLAAGAALLAAVAAFGLERDLYVLGGGLAVFGLLRLVAAARAARGGALVEIMADLGAMPATMRRLALAQFLSWLALFVMWIYTTPVVTQYVFGATDPASKAYNDGADWVGILFAVYNGVAALAAFALPPLARRLGPAMTHLACLLVGAASYASLLVIREPGALVLPFVGVGVAWASILTMPYVILAGALPPAKLGVYMGIFNFFIVLPQLMVATLMGAAMRALFPGEPVWTMAAAALVMAAAALAMLRLREPALAGAPRPA